MSFGFFGIQFGWGLQMANMSSIYQYLGAEADKIAFLWLAAPVTGLLVQPIIGYYSDRTWTRIGRRRPYFLFGAIFASLSLILMPNSSAVWMAAGLLWILDASVNISMEPFRAFVGDLLPHEQRKAGFAMQSLFIGLGGVLSSLMPWLLGDIFGIVDEAGEGNAIPLAVHLSFYIGSAVFFVAVMYTIFTTKEYPPEDMEAFEREKKESAGVGNAFAEIFQGIGSMPRVMKQLAVVQFFTWFALFCMWIYFVPAVAEHVFGGTPGNGDMPASAEYEKGANWGGVLFAVYQAVCAVFSFVLIKIGRKFTARDIHMVCLLVGAAGLFLATVITDPMLLILPMVLIGVAWASIVSMPYAMLSNALPPEKMGFYMGVFNFFIVLPQIAASLGLGLIMEHALGNHTMNAVMLGAVSMFIAAVCVRIVDKDVSEGIAE